MGFFKLHESLSIKFLSKFGLSSYQGMWISWIKGIIMGIIIGFILGRF